MTQASGFTGGDGTPSNPYQICMPTHLDNVRNHLSSAFIQTADIDMAGVAFVPIGTNGGNVDPFTGSFNGNNLKIQNLVIDQPTVKRIAIFKMTGAGSIIENINLVNLAVTGFDFVSGIVALNFGIVRHCSVSGTVNGGDIIGGLVASLEAGGSIDTSSSRGIVNGGSNLGGLVGKTDSGSTITNSYSNSTVSGTGLFLGGLVGSIIGTAITNSYSSGLVLKEPGFGIGGFIGVDSGGSSITSSFWDTESSTHAVSAGGIGKTTAEMQTQATFDPPWDFTNVWTIDEGNDYPRLQTPTLTCSLDCQCDDSKECTTDTCNAGSCVNDSAIVDGSACTQDNLQAGICADGICAGDPIPAVSEWGLLAMTLMMLTVGCLVLRQHTLPIES